MGLKFWKRDKEQKTTVVDAIINLTNVTAQQTKYQAEKHDKITQLAALEVQEIVLMLRNDKFKFDSPDNNGVIHMCLLPTSIYDKIDITPLAYRTIQFLRYVKQHQTYVRTIMDIYEQHGSIREVKRRASPYFAKVIEIEQYLLERYESKDY